jgi:chromosome segregation ATPase
VTTIYGDEWDSYPKGEEMARDSQCLLGAITKEQRAKLTNKRKELDAVAEAITSKINNLVDSGNKISQASSTGREQLKRDMAEYKSEMERFNRTTNDMPTRDGGLETSVRQTLMERSRVGMWAAVGAVSIGVLVYLMRRRRTTG